MLGRIILKKCSYVKSFYNQDYAASNCSLSSTPSPGKPSILQTVTLSKALLITNIQKLMLTFMSQQNLKCYTIGKSILIDSQICQEWWEIIWQFLGLLLRLKELLGGGNWSQNFAVDLMVRLLRLVCCLRTGRDNGMGSTTVRSFYYSIKNNMLWHFVCAKLNR